MSNAPRDISSGKDVVVALFDGAQNGVATSGHRGELTDLTTVYLGSGLITSGIADASWSSVQRAACD